MELAPEKVFIKRWKDLDKRFGRGKYLRIRVEQGRVSGEIMYICRESHCHFVVDLALADKEVVLGLLLKMGIDVEFEYPINSICPCCNRETIDLNEQPF